MQKLVFLRVKIHAHLFSHLLNYCICDKIISNKFKKYLHPYLPKKHKHSYFIFRIILFNKINFVTVNSIFIDWQWLKFEHVSDPFANFSFIENDTFCTKVLICTFSFWFSIWSTIQFLFTKIFQVIDSIVIFCITIWLVSFKHIFNKIGMKTSVSIILFKFLTSYNLVTLFFSNIFLSQYFVHNWKYIFIH